MDHIRKIFSAWGLLALCASLFGATPDIKVEVYRERRAAIDPFQSLEGKPPESTYELISIYLPKDEMEKLAFSGIAEIETFQEGKDVHPWVGGPLYLVIMSDGKQLGRTILFYSGADVGFYIVGSFVRSKEGLTGHFDSEKMYPVSSVSLCKILRRAIPSDEHENKK